jgi:hypothetical protein
VYAIKCSRISKVVKYDQESFADCWGDEIADHKADTDGDAAAGDGTWLYDMGDRWQHGTKHETAGLLRSAGTMRVFRSKEEANRQAALVWVSLQASCPDPEAPAEGEESSDDSDDDSEGSESDEEAAQEKRSTRVKSRSSSKGSGRAVASSKGKGSSSRGTAGSSGAKAKPQAAAAVDPDSFKSMTADGRACWRREQRFYSDPWGCDLKNVLTSTLTVEVVEAQLVW